MRSDWMFPRVTVPQIALPKDYQLADTFYNRLRRQIEETQKQLKKDEELAIYYHSGGEELIRVSEIGFHNPNLIILYGSDQQANECSVLVHMQALQLVLKILRLDSGERRRIGFLND